MSRTKKAPTYQFGIEITKPHSQEMYDHNNAIASEMVRNIMSAIHIAYSQEMGTEESTDKDIGNLHKIVKCFTGYSFGDEYDFDGMKNEAINTLANVENWTLHEEYSWLCSVGLVPKLKQGMVGHKPIAYVKYWTDEAGSVIDKIIEVIKDMDGAKLDYVNKGSDSEYPYIKVYTQGQAEDVVQNLDINGIPAEVDLYEDDDGEGDDGRPIILQRWSVKFKNDYRTVEKIKIPCSLEQDNEWANESI